MIDVRDQFGELTAVKLDKKRTDTSGNKYWFCTCSCGARKSVRQDHLRLGRVRSCGCLHRRLASERASILAKANTKHAAAKTPLHNRWMAMHDRCRNPNNTAYNRYGGRGIYVCKRWRKFENFLADMGHPPSGHTLDRIQNNGPYSPQNCRWATRKQQQQNLSNTHHLTIDGETRTITEWADIRGIPRKTISERLSRGWSSKRAVIEDNSRSKPLISHCKRGHKFTKKNTAWYQGSRHCKDCQKVRAKRWTK